MIALETRKYLKPCDKECSPCEAGEAQWARCHLIPNYMAGSTSKEALLRAGDGPSTLRPYFTRECTCSQDLAHCKWRLYSITTRIWRVEIAIKSDLNTDFQVQAFGAPWCGSPTVESTYLIW